MRVIPIFIFVFISIFSVDSIVAKQSGYKLKSLKAEVDSLKKVPLDSAVTMQLYHVALNFITIDPEEMVPIKEYLLQKGEESNSLLAIAISKFLSGEYLRRTGDDYNAFTYLKSCEQLFEQLGNVRMKAETKRMIASVYRNTGDMQAALDTYQEALASYQSRPFKWKIYSSIALVYSKLTSEGGGTAAVDSCLKYNRLYKSVSQGRKKAAFVNIYKNLGTAFKKSYLLGRAHHFDSARYYFDTALEFARATGVKARLPSTLGAVAEMFVLEGKAEKAIPLLKEAWELEKNKEKFSSKHYLLNVFITAYKAMGDYQSAHYYQEQLLASKEKEFDHDLKLLRVVVGDLKDKEAEQVIELQEAQFSKEKTLRNVLIGVICLLSVITFLIYQNRKNKIKSNQDLLLKNQQILDVEASKSRWFINISHELRTPLTLIQGPVNKVLSESNLNAMTKDNLTLADRNIKYLSNIVNEILDLSKFEEGEIKLVQQVVNYTHLVRSVAASFDSFAKTNEIAFNVASKENIFLAIDEQKIRKLLINLVANAFKFTPNGGTITLNLGKTQNGILLKVVDTGEGISKEDLPNVFNRFYQSTDPKKDRQGGTGIGLSLAKEVTKLHGGDLTVDSELGKGTVFSLVLPPSLIREVQEETLEELPPVLETLEKKDYISRLADKSTILLVEDNSDMRKYVKSILSPDYNLLEAEDGVVALEILAKKKPDLIVSDVMMPRLDGIALAKQIRDNDQLTAIPMVMLTALHSEEDMIYTLRIGVDDYIHKPFNEEELKARVNNLIQNRHIRISYEGEEEVSYEDHLLQQLEKTVKTQLNSGLLSVSYLANQVSLSESQLRRKLTKATGLTPLQFIQEIRLMRARTLLEQKKYPTLNEVAGEVGLERTSHFSMLFERRFGKKPSDYLL